MRKGKKKMDVSCKMPLFVFSWDSALEKRPFCPERPPFLAFQKASRGLKVMEASGKMPLFKNGHFASSVLYFWPFKGLAEGLKMTEASAKMPLLAFFVWTSFSKKGHFARSVLHFWPPQKGQENETFLGDLFLRSR